MKCLIFFRAVDSSQIRFTRQISVFFSLIYNGQTFEKTVPGQLLEIDSQSIDFFKYWIFDSYPLLWKKKSFSSANVFLTPIDGRFQNLPDDGKKRKKRSSHKKIFTRASRGSCQNFYELMTKHKELSWKRILKVLKEVLGFKSRKRFFGSKTDS